MVYPSSNKLRPKGCWPRGSLDKVLFCPYHIFGNLINQILLCGNSPNIEYLYNAKVLLSLRKILVLFIMELVKYNIVVSY